MMETVTGASGRFTVDDSPALSLWDMGASSWIDALQDVAPQVPAFNWPNPSTIARRRSQWDSAPHPVWDGGISEWIDSKHGPFASYDVPQWINGPAITRRASRWDGPPQSAWDAGASRWLDSAPGWDTPPGTDRRTWIIGRAGQFGGNVRSATGIMHTARVWIKPPDPATIATLARRELMRQAVAQWHADRETCTAIAINQQAGTYWSPFHRWIAHYLRTH